MRRKPEINVGYHNGISILFNPQTNIISADCLQITLNESLIIDYILREGEMDEPFDLIHGGKVDFVGQDVVFNIDEKKVCIPLRKALEIIIEVKKERLREIMNPNRICSF